MTAVWAEFIPPVEEGRLPSFQSTLEAAIVGQVDVIRNFL
jgi:hypothetical protein